MKVAVERAINELRWRIGIPDHALSVLAAIDGKVATLLIAAKIMSYFRRKESEQC